MSQYSDLILSETGIVGYWRLGEASGTLADSKGSNTGTAVNAPTFGVAGALPDDPNAAMTFLAASIQHITLSGITGNGFSNGPYSMELWFKTTASGANFAMLDVEALTGGSGDIGLGLGNLANGKVTVTDGGNRIVSSAAAPLYNDGKWHHVVATKIVAGNVWKLYVDGNDVTTADSFPTQTTTSGADTNGRIGIQYNAGTQRWPFTGSLDEVAIYNVALSQAQAYTHFTVGLQSRLGYSIAVSRSAGPRGIRRARAYKRAQANGNGIAAATTANAEVATASGTAADASIQIAPNAGQATGTGAANTPTAGVKPTSGVSTATGTANAPALSLGPTSQVATGTGAANAPTGGVQPGAGNATGTGAANAPASAVQPGAGQATAIGAANTPAAQVSGISGVATGSGVAGAPSAGITALGGIATGTATAFNPTVILQGSVTAFAEVATASVTAFDPTGIISDRRGHAGLSRYTRLGQAMPPKPPEDEVIPMAVIAYAGVARGFAMAYSPTTSWNDDESTIELLMGI